MHSAIIVVGFPTGEYSDSKWRKFMADVNSLARETPDPLEKQAGVWRLSENVWQVNFSENSAALARLVFYAGDHKLTYGILPLEDEPRWLPDDFDPRPT